MKQSTRMIALLSLFFLSTGVYLPSVAQRVATPLSQDNIEQQDSTVVDSTLFKVRELDELLSELYKFSTHRPAVNKIIGPWVISGYRHIPQTKKFNTDYSPSYPGLMMSLPPDSIAEEFDEMSELTASEENGDTENIFEDNILVEPREETQINKAVLDENYIPDWLYQGIHDLRRQEDLMYSTMIAYPSTIDYAYWDLPVPPTLPEDEVTFEAFLKKLDLPEIETNKAILPEEILKKIHWLHNFNASAQFSQAYVSSNWYQGGNNHLALLLGLNWNVQLNQVYHPNLLFQSNLSYKLGLNSTPQDTVHRYSLSEDLLQWNLNTGLKAREKWYYSFNAVFKTQIFKNYLLNSSVRKASFLSPGDFNMGLGMSYTNKKPNLELTATISPLSYNLKTCITDKIDHEQFNIAADAYTHSEFGSNAEFNMSWKMMWNISYKTRLFLFTDYSYYLGDWEHTFNFDINRFLSTQIYVRMRYDTSTNSDSRWKHFMLREVLSFGLSYTFSTK